MELYFSPLACSLATRIALYEAGADARFTRVDLRTKRAEGGEDFTAVNPLGQVPALSTDDGEILTENAAVLQYVADRFPAAGLAPVGAAARSRLHEWLGFIGTELHKGIFLPLFSSAANDDVKAFARAAIPSRFAHLSRRLEGRTTLLDGFSVADAYLVTILNWTAAVGPSLSDWPVVQAYHRAQLARPSVARAVAEERALYAEEQQRAVKS